jgi:hypothetical protein
MRDSPALSFPRSPWECLPGRSAARVIGGPASGPLRDAERPGRHSHVKRGNDEGVGRPSGRQGRPKPALPPVAAALFLLLLAGSGASADDGFPRLMGMNIGAKNYDDPAYRKQLSRLDAVILGFYPGWNTWKNKDAMREAVKAIKAGNPNIRIGQYTVLSEAPDSKSTQSADTDKSRKIDAENWWLRDAAGKRVQWTGEFGNYEINVTHWTKPDASGRRFPEWLAERDHRIYFQAVPEFSLWFFDNSVSKPAVKSADWNLDGHNDRGDDPRIVAAHRQGHAAEWARARQLAPAVHLIANTDDLSSPEFSKKLNGAFLEALIGKNWSVENRVNWEEALRRYHAALQHTLPPNLVGFNVWGRPNDYQRLRYGLASALLDDGYFSYTDEKAGYSSVVWFDEYDADLGRPVDPPQFQPWKNGVYRRRFEKGMVLVNPRPAAVTVAVEPGYRRLQGRQAPAVNNGQPASTVRLGAKDGIVLVRMEPARAKPAAAR